MKTLDHAKLKVIMASLEIIHGACDDLMMGMNPGAKAAQLSSEEITRRLHAIATQANIIETTRRL